MSGNASKRYPAELKQRVVRMYAKIRPQYDKDWAAMGEVSELLGVGQQRDQALLDHIRRVHADKFGVSGPQKVWIPSAWAMTAW